MEHNPVSGIAQKGSTAGHGSQNTAFAFDPQIFLDPTELGHPTDEGFGLMGIEVVTDHMPTRGLWVGGKHCLQMGQKIFLRSCGSTERSHDLSADDISTQDKGPCAMTEIFEFASLHFPDGQRQAWMLALEGLNPVNSSVLTVRSPCLAPSGACS